MMHRVIPGWSWDEELDAAQRARLAARIVAELNTRLSAAPGAKLYVATGHPTVSRHLRKTLEGIELGGRDLRKVARWKRPDAYATPDPDLFACILPIIFEWGPPEVSILAIAGDPDALQDALGDVLTGIVERTHGVIGWAVCMDFDSGDLVRIL